MENTLIKIARQFEARDEIVEVKVLGEGFINDTYVAKTVGDKDDYILQRKNKEVFRNVPGMMDNISRVCAHMKEKVRVLGGDPEREAMTLVPTHGGELYHLDEQGEYWALCLLIRDHICYDSVDAPPIAEAGGKGIGKFQCMLADFDGRLVDTLPGFHNIRFRFDQWDEVLAKDPVNRKAELSEEISWIEDRREQMLDFYSQVESGAIPCRISHNDTKISNILFDREGEVLCVIDLDTVLSSTVLNDFGDAMRSYTNTGLEDDREPDRVSMDLEIFRAFSRGYLSEALTTLSDNELKYLAFSAIYITYEQVLRFLMDYIDGDNYYRTKSDDHNLVRTRAQYALLWSMESQLDEMKAIIKEESKVLATGGAFNSRISP